ncbi:hypothetical protein SOM61_00275 [Massilia sp. CFBP9012]|uniref:hypothetical protein n=1 Tax=Massilia sp. CFBP9012 TaxID=3096531 RepID=UPI002A69F654|nr:hypothetical protein [Massilia sp. CFBP9012]MDY0973379.1 hypothetical protein [Massilia sp. CFBP9012]
MKPIAIVIRIVLAAAVLGASGAIAQVGPPAQARPAPAAERAPPRITYDAAERALLKRLATPAAAQVFRQYNAASGRRIQDHLVVIYGVDPDYVRDAGGARRPLGDGVVGPVTLRWLTRFCKEYGIVASDPHFERAVVASLEQVADIVSAHPQWVDILASPEFNEWLNDQPTTERVRSLQRRRSGDASQVNALIEQFKREQRPAPPTRAAEPTWLTFGYDPARREQTGNSAQIAASLAPLSTRAPEDEQIFEEDVLDALDGLQIAPGTMPLIKRYSRVDAYLVGPELLQRLRREGLPESAVIELKQALEGVEHPSAQEFLDALREVSDNSTQREALERKRLTIVRGARVTRYKVPANLASSLAVDAPLDPAVAAVFAGFQHIQYPTRELFDAAIDWQVRRALGMCRDPIPDRQQSQAVQDRQGELGDDGIAALATLMRGEDELFARIRELRGRKVACTAVDVVEADVLAYQVASFVTPNIDSKIDFRIRNTVPTPAPRVNAWAPDGCRCARSEAEGMAYGFYPLWLDAGERQIDFGALTRIGLYGVTVGDHGVLEPPPGMDSVALPDHLAPMVRAAHRHNVKVDWVVSRNDWTAWRTMAPARKREVLDALLRNIATLLERAPPDGGQTTTRLASLGLDVGQTGGDGVTLHFRDFPSADKELFNDFVRKLSDRLKRMRPARRLSMAVAYDELGLPGPFAFRNLVELIAGDNPLPKDKTFAESGPEMMADMPILVMLPESTQDSKKALRTAIQNALHGTEAVRLQWAILPVVEYDRVGSIQLVNDIVFAAANYRGIGFWPLAFASPTGADGIVDARDANHLLTSYLQPFGEQPTKLSYYASYLCPHRLWLRWLFWGSLALALGVGAVYFSCRGCNERLDNNGLYFAGMVAVLVLPLVTLSVLVVSDPLLTGYFKYTLALYGTGGIVAAALVSRYYFKKSRRKLP